MVTNLLKSLDSWLKAQDGAEVSYSDLREVLDVPAQVGPAVTPSALGPYYPLLDSLNKLLSI